MRSRTRHKKRKNKQKGGLSFEEFKAKLPSFGQDNSYFTTLKTTIQALPDKITATSSLIKDRLQAGIAAVRGTTGGSTRKHRKHRKH